MSTLESTDRTDSLKRARAFLAELDRVIAQPGPRSVIRRGLGHSSTDHKSGIAAYAQTIPLVPAKDVGKPAEAAYIVVAALIAGQPRTADDTVLEVEPDAMAVTDPEPPADGEPKTPKATSLGRSLALGVNAGFLGHTTTQARLHHMCRLSFEDAVAHLPRLVSRLRDNAVPVDWDELIVDLATWTAHRPYTTKRWLRDFHRTVIVKP